MTAPLVSVIIPAYNRAHSVSRSIDSVLRQSYRPLEVIVVDDGSTDGTAESLAAFGDQISLIRQQNGGPSSARNAGVRQSKGSLIAFLDSDDTWEPQKLESQVRLMILGGNKVPCCVCNARNIVNGAFNKTSFEIAEVDCKLKEGYWMNPAELISTRFLLFNQVVLIRRVAFERIGGFKECMRLLEDHDLAFRLSLLGPWGFISEPLVTKYDQEDGVGVQAQRDPRAHVNAWVAALLGFLDEPIETNSNVHCFIQRSLRDSAIESQAVEMMVNGTNLDYALGRFLKFSLRIKGTFRRRMPSWPRVEAVAPLDF
jgi:glycosyltransferase involved in cell wall biosynthesis